MVAFLSENKTRAPNITLDDAERRTKYEVHIVSSVTELFI